MMQLEKDFGHITSYPMSFAKVRGHESLDDGHTLFLWRVCLRKRRDGEAPAHDIVGRLKPSSLERRLRARLKIAERGYELHFGKADKLELSNKENTPAFAEHTRAWKYFAGRCGALESQIVALLWRRFDRDIGGMH